MIFGGILMGVGLFVLVTQVLIPKRVSALLEMIKTGKLALAIRIAKQLIGKDPRNMELHYALGLAYIASNKPELALMEMKTVNQMGVFTGIIRETVFRKKIAELYLEFNQDEEALKEYVLLIKLEAAEPEHYFQAGMIFEHHAKTDQAHKYYRKTIELSPNHSAAHQRLGMILYRNKRIAEAKTELDLALKFSPENYEAAYYLGKICKDNQDYKEALIMFEKSVKDPELKMKALIERGICYLSQKNYERAQSELERASKLGTPETLNDTLHARYFLSLCYENLKDFESAIGEWEFIYSKKTTFKDVGEKLSVYQDMRVDDKIKDYITSTKQVFLQICMKLTIAQGFVVRDSSEIPNGLQIIAMEGDSEQWRNTKKMPKIIQYYRISENIDEPILRPLNDEIQKLHGNRVIIVTNTGFTRAAVGYAETRPFTLVTKDGLQSLLKKVSWSKP